MATPSRAGRSKKGLYVDLSPEIVEAIRDLAESNRRAVWEEVQHALERHLSAPPKLVTPEIPPAEVQPGRKKRRRPKSDLDT